VTSAAAADDFDHVAVDDVSRHFGRRRAVSRVSFTAREGTILGLLGPNGAGKSTMLAMLATLLRPTAGAIRFGTLDPRAHGAAARARWSRTRARSAMATVASRRSARCG